MLGRERLDALVEAAQAPGAAALREELAGLAGSANGAGGLLDLGRIEHELRVAQRIQRSLVLMADETLDGWEIATDYRPALQIGGDFFDVFPILGEGPRRLGLVIADVSGKGISAAILMAFVRAVMRGALDRTGSPADALERTNAILARERRTGGLLVTGLCCVVELETGELRLANAGHEAPLLLPADGAPPRWLPGGGPLLGAFGQLDLDEESGVLAPGERLVLYTDGITDASDSGRARFGEARFADVVARTRAGSAGETCRAVIDAVLDHQGAADQADDLALVVLRRDPAER